MKFVTQFYTRKIDATGLAVFRIAIGCVLFWEVFQLYSFRHLIFDEIPFISFGNIDFKYGLLLWLAAIVVLIFGLFTRVVTILNYTLSLVFFATIDNFGNHMLNVFMAINFLLMFTSVSQVLSLDSVITRFRNPNSRVNQHTVSVLQYYSFVFMALALVYFISLFDKLLTDYWRNGLVIWKFASVPAEFARMDLSFLLNQEYFIRFLAYFSLLFESVFIFICFKKRYRIWVFSLGVLLHVGILICFPFSPFALGFISVYILLLPVSFWRTAKHHITCRKRVPVFFRAHNLWSKRLMILVISFDVFNCFECIEVDTNEQQAHQLLSKPLFWLHGKENDILTAYQALRFILLRLPLFVPLGLLLFIPFFNRLLYRNTVLSVKLLITSLKPRDNNTDTCTELKSYKIKLIAVFFVGVLLLQGHSILRTKFAKTLNLPTGIVQVHNMARVVLGISQHAVFTYPTEKQHLYSIAITHQRANQELWLPLTKQNGQADYYKKDPIRRKSFFSSYNPDLDSLKLNHYVRDYSAFWSFKNNIDLDSTHFNVYIKKLKIPETWELDVYKKNIMKPWVLLGTITWQDTLFYSQLDYSKRFH